MHLRRTQLSLPHSKLTLSRVSMYQSMHITLTSQCGLDCGLGYRMAIGIAWDKPEVSLGLSGIARWNNPATEKAIPPRCAVLATCHLPVCCQPPAQPRFSPLPAPCQTACYDTECASVRVSTGWACAHVYWVGACVCVRMGGRGCARARGCALCISPSGDLKMVARGAVALPWAV